MPPVDAVTDTRTPSIAVAGTRTSLSRRRIADWPHCRNNAQPAQSSAIFSGSHACGTSEKPSRAKYAGLVRERADRGVTVRARLAGQQLDERPPVARAAQMVVHDQRTHFGHAAAERRQLRTPCDVAVVNDHEETVGVPGDLLFGPRQQPAGA